MHDTQLDENHLRGKMKPMKFNKAQISMHDTQLDENLDFLSSFFQCQIWKILVCGAQICDIVRWSDEASDEILFVDCIYR